jgi:hypothetical protein
MILERLLVSSPGLSATSYRVGGISAFCIVGAYIAITLLYVTGGVWPDDGEGWLAFLAADSLLWWTALSFAVVADLLTIPVVWAIYLALRKVNKTATAAGCIFFLVLVAVDMTIVWPDCFLFLMLSAKYMAAVSDGERQLFVVAATKAYETLSAPWIMQCEILCPSMGCLAIGLVTTKVAFRKVVGYLGLLAGVVGVLSVVGPFFHAALGIGMFVTFVMITVWFFLVGSELLALARRGGS